MWQILRVTTADRLYVFSSKRVVKWNLFGGPGRRADRIQANSVSQTGNGSHCWNLLRDTLFPEYPLVTYQCEGLHLVLLPTSHGLDEQIAHSPALSLFCAVVMSSSAHRGYEPSLHVFVPRLWVEVAVGCCRTLKG